ncbi:MAG: CDP-glucose 4,6-dehydratase [Bacteroidia bacterium]|nr:CDP-glucose 4,6-dehydratase [Bacteroidia bacterium]
MIDFASKYKDKKVLITGHTGFKGCWLSIWLHSLGANVIGLSLDPATTPNIYDLSNISENLVDIRGDIRDKNKVFNIFAQFQPEIVFHLAAQALVLDSYNDPLYTYETNTLGTANILEAIRKSNSVHSAVFITSDKVYENHEWIWGYRENDPKGGFDPYSSSKGAAELIISSYRNSFFNPKNHSEHKKAIASVRAGNVIGGGDWAENRLIPDCVKAIESNETIKIRNPFSKRPWQHVLEPLSAYLLLAVKMMEQPIEFSNEWNIGPTYENIVNVKSLVEKFIVYYGTGKWMDVSNGDSLHEAKLLSLDISKAFFYLAWKPVLNLDETVRLTAAWYKEYKTKDVLSLCLEQINYYMNKWK